MKAANLGVTWTWGFKTYKGENKKSFCQGWNMMRYHHFQKKLNFQRNAQSHWYFHRKLCWERRKKITINILPITEVPVLYMQEIQLNGNMSEKIDVFMSVYISLRNLTNSLARVFFHSFIININIDEIYSPRYTPNSSWWLFLRSDIVGSEMVEDFHFFNLYNSVLFIFYVHVFMQ